MRYKCIRCESALCSELVEVKENIHLNMCDSNGLKPTHMLQDERKAEKKGMEVVKEETKKEKRERREDNLCKCVNKV